MKALMTVSVASVTSKVLGKFLICVRKGVPGLAVTFGGGLFEHMLPAGAASR